MGLHALCTLGENKKMWLLGLVRVHAAEDKTMHTMEPVKCFQMRVEVSVSRERDQVQSDASICAAIKLTAQSARNPTNQCIQCKSHRPEYE